MPPPATDALRPPPDGARAKWYQSIWFVLVMLFFVMGPLGLPLLWKSPKFPNWSKVVLTLAMAVYTYMLVTTFQMAMQMGLKRVTELQANFP